MRMRHEVIINGLTLRFGDHAHPCTVETLKGPCRPSLHNVRGSDTYELCWPCCDTSIRITTERTQ